uniref:Uncharacterized protein n=1 Tax=Oryza nivara TaxID=4536 RepID=A0A0E0J808_ORYNI
MGSIAPAHQRRGTDSIPQSSRAGPARSCISVPCDRLGFCSRISSLRFVLASVHPFSGLGNGARAVEQPGGVGQRRTKPAGRQRATTSSPSSSRPTTAAHRRAPARSSPERHCRRFASGPLSRPWLPTTARPHRPCTHTRPSSASTTA